MVYKDRLKTGEMVMRKTDVNNYEDKMAVSTIRTARA